METTKNKLPENITIFFNNLSEELDKKLFFYGSIQRDDYFPGKSDIDVDIFTDNIESTITKMQHFLNVPKKKFKKFIFRLKDCNNKVITGYKIMYKNDKDHFSAEFSIYNEKNKECILKNQLLKIKLPFYASWMLIILKFIYYNLGLMSRTIYAKYKGYILHHVINAPDDHFIVLD